MNKVYIAIAPDKDNTISPELVIVFKFALAARLCVQAWRDQGYKAFYIEKYCLN